MEPNRTDLTKEEYLKEFETLLSNISSDFDELQDAVYFYNSAARKPVLEIRDDAYNIVGQKIEGYKALHFTEHYDKEGLDSFWKMFHSLQKEKPLLERIAELEKALEGWLDIDELNAFATHQLIMKTNSLLNTKS